MNYKLALKLKKAGFPQNGGHKYVYTKEEPWNTTEQSDYQSISTPHRDTWVKAPTLEELIEACGKIHSRDGRTYKFILWYAEDDLEWHAGYYQFGDSNYIDCSPNENEYGNSPTIAVANLWLALNQKS